VCYIHEERKKQRRGDVRKKKGKVKDRKKETKYSASYKRKILSISIMHA
jgi:hypothetical protein